MNALDKIFSRKNILDSWDREKSSFRRDTFPDVDKVSRNQFSDDILDQAAEMSVMLRTNSYNFKKLRPIAIPKGNGKIRLINVPTIRDRFVQRMVLRFLEKKYGTAWKTGNSFSSIRDSAEGVHHSLKTVASTLKYTDHVIRADLSQYFDTIDRELLFKEICRRVRERSLYPLIRKIIDCETAQRHSFEKAMFKKGGLRKGVGLRQGMPLSPLFSFLFLSRLDVAQGLGFHRYVDDLLFFGPDKKLVERQFYNYKENCEKLGLTVHPLGSAKTVYLPPTTNFEFLGIKIVRESSKNAFELSSETKKRIEDDIKSSVHLDRTDKSAQKNWLSSVVTKTSNLRRNYKSAYHICRNWNDFDIRLQELQIYMCREIVTQLQGVKDAKNKEVLLRIFAIN